MEDECEIYFASLVPTSLYPLLQFGLRLPSAKQGRDHEQTYPARQTRSPAVAWMTVSVGKSLFFEENYLFSLISARWTTFPIASVHVEE